MKCAWGPVGGSPSAHQAPEARGESESDDVPGHLTRLQLLEGVVDLLELQTAGDHQVELQFAPEVEVDQSGHVEAEAVRAHGRALDLLLLQEFRAVELDPGADRDHAD